MMETIRPLARRTSLAGEVAEELRNFIGNNRMQPGTKLPSLDSLAEQFQVSKATIREAIHALDYVGLLEVKHGEGVFIRGFDSKPIAEHLLFGVSDLDPVQTAANVFDVRELFEVNVLEWAVPKATPEACDALEECVQTMMAQETPEEKMAYDRRFHLMISEMTQNPVMSRFGDIVERTFSILRSLNGVDDVAYPAEETAREHLAICETIRAGDTPQAKELMRAHIRKAKTTTLPRIKSLVDDRNRMETLR